MDTFKKIFLAGLGAINLSRERVQELVDELVEKGKVQEKESAKMVDELVKKAETVRKDVEKNVREQVHNAYGKLNLATQDQLKKLERSIQDLQVQLAKSQPIKKPRTSKKASPKK